MTDILKEKLEKEEEIELLTFTCGTCEKHFIILKKFSKPLFCPFCGSIQISVNEEIKINPPDNRQAESGLSGPAGR